MTFALIGSESLLGREIRDIAATSSSALELRLIAALGEQPGKLTLVGDEPALVSGLNSESLAGARAVFLAGSAESSRQALELLNQQPGATIIDLTGAAEERPDARLRAPLVGAEVEAEEHGGATVHVIAHPAAIALALFLRRLQAHDPIRRSVIQVFAPASEHGMPGVE